MYALALESFKCCGCGDLFKKIEAELSSEILTGEAWGSSFAETELFYICPTCGSDQLEEVYCD